MVFMKEFFGKDDFEKNQQKTKKHAKLPSRQRVKLLCSFLRICVVCLLQNVFRSHSLTKEQNALLPKISLY